MLLGHLTLAMVQRERTRRVTGVDFSHFNLAMRCLASGGGGGGGCWGCIERPSYIHLSPPTRSPPSLSRRSSLARPLALRPLFPSFPSDIRGLPPLPPLFQPSLPLPPSPPLPPPTGLPPIPPSSLSSPRTASRPSFATHLPKAPLSSTSLFRPRPFLNPDILLPPSYSLPPASFHLVLALSFSRPLPRNTPADKQTADTLQFYAIVSFFICLLVPR